jgi:hypothetical protein
VKDKVSDSRVRGYAIPLSHDQGSVALAMYIGCSKILFGWII